MQNAQRIVAKPSSQNITKKAGETNLFSAFSLGFLKSDGARNITANPIRTTKIASTIISLLN